MDGVPQIGGAGHRFALRDYYENVEVADNRLWHLSDDDLAAEKIRCEGKLAQAKKNIRPLGLTVWLLAGIIGTGVIGPISMDDFGWSSLIGTLLWFMGMVICPLRKFVETADFERMVIQHYQTRLQLIRLIQRDRT